jgi:hypothetical protein
MTIRGIIIKTTMKIVIKRKVLRKIIAIIKTISYQFKANKARTPSYFKNP